MLKTLWATVRQGKIELLESTELPEGTRVLVTLLPHAEEDTTANVYSRGQQMAEILSRLAADDAFFEVNPIAWQREVRQDRPLPSRRK
ncbi:MAG: hypothetical protein ACRC2R_12155 [Xenococcaceae cyanobacterium]